MEYSAQGTTAAGRYEALVGSRSVYDREAKESSKLTIPSLIPNRHQVLELESKHLFKQQEAEELTAYQTNC